MYFLQLLSLEVQNQGVGRFCACKGLFFGLLTAVFLLFSVFFFFKVTNPIMGFYLQDHISTLLCTTASMRTK